jgi:hypothetical protein
MEQCKQLFFAEAGVELQLFLISQFEILNGGLVYPVNEILQDTP